MAAYTTKKPTGLSIKRNANALVIEWKLGDKDYGGGQTFQYRYPGQGWQSITIGTATTKTHIVVPVASFFPTTGKFINKVYFRIRGKRRNFTEDGKSYTPSVSDWATKEYSILPPNRPTMSAALSGSADNVCTFSWDVKVDSEAQKYFVKVQCQTCLSGSGNCPPSCMADGRSGRIRKTSGKTPARSIRTPAPTGRTS